jgi:hypothetical protein
MCYLLQLKTVYFDAFGPFVILYRPSKVFGQLNLFWFPRIRILMCLSLVLVKKAPLHFRCLLILDYLFGIASRG